MQDSTLPSIPRARRHFPRRPQVRRDLVRQEPLHPLHRWRAAVEASSVRPVSCESTRVGACGSLHLSSNTIPTDVINFSQQLQVRDPVRVLVRREGGVNSQESVSSVTPGINIKHTYVYLTITGSARTEASAQSDAGPGTIGSGRANGGQISEEANRAKEYKLDMLVKLLDDYPLWQAVIHVWTYSMLEAVVVSQSPRQIVFST